MIGRRAVLAGLAGLPLAARAGGTGDAAPFSPDLLVARARALSRTGFTRRPEVPAAWRRLSYDQYRAIRPRPDRALWQGGERPLRADLLAPGLFYRRPVRIFAVDGGLAREIPFEIGRFALGAGTPDLPVSDRLGYSGLRLRAELAAPGRFDEVAVFQGASYFRAIGRGAVYGASARGLAIGVAEPAGEEFPDFTEFYLEAPEPGATLWHLHALLDSPSATGAYRFDIQAGDACVIDVRATLFPRTRIDHAGLAPLTSMFLFDATSPARFDDFRPAVHDSNGLSIVNGAGELLWRPLANPARLQSSSFVDENPAGFGLMQRARAYSDFADLEARYHRRPGVWIAPAGGWGPGAVTLVEIPSDSEANDNIVAYWRPRHALAAGEPVEIAYRMTWSLQEPERQPVARVLSTAMGAHPAGGRLAVIDFGPHAALPDDLTRLAVHTSANLGTVTGGVLQRNPETGGARLAFGFDPAGRAEIELRAQLMHDGRRVSEVWLYRWTA